MMGLTDRVQPWARRFQRAPRDADAPERRDPGRTLDRLTRAPDANDPEAARPRRRTGRFVRGAMQER